MSSVEKEDWLEKILQECEEQKRKEISKLKKESPKISFKVESGKESFGLKMDIGDLLDKFYIPIQLLEKAQMGVANLLNTLDLDFKTNYAVKGLSGEYIIPFYLEDKDRQIIFTPALFPCFLEAFGIPVTESYNAFAPFMTLDFFKYIDIMNAQEKPTIMAFYGITNFSDMVNVNLLEFIKVTLQDKGITPDKGDLEISMKKEGLYGINIKNMFESYGIPRIDMNVKDALRAHILSPDIPEGRRELIGYREELGMIRFLNPSVLDYSLFACHKQGMVEPEEMGNFMRRGELLGHYPSFSNTLPDIKPKRAVDDPLDLMEYLEQKGKATEVKGKYELTPEGQKLVEIEVYGKPSAITLQKIWNIIKNANHLIPFLKFI